MISIMENDIASFIIPPPLSQIDCRINGEFDTMRYYMYKMRVRQQLSQSTLLELIISCKKKWYVGISLLSQVSMKKKRTIRRI